MRPVLSLAPSTDSLILNALLPSAIRLDDSLRMIGSLAGATAKYFETFASRSSCQIGPHTGTPHALEASMSLVAIFVMGSPVVFALCRRFLDRTQANP